MSTWLAQKSIKPSKNLKTLGVILDENLSLATHVQSVSRACHYHIRALKHIRPALTSDSAAMVACGIVGSRLDYCNSLLYGTSVDNLSRLQRVQNTLARVVTKSGWKAHSLPILERLHWLPVEHRIRFKIATLTFRALHQNNPPYLHDLISRYTPARALRSTDKYLLNTKRTNTKIGDRAFSAAAPETWNALPTDIILIDSLEKFKINLKTHLFRTVLDNHVTFFRAHDLATRPGRKANLWRVANDCTYLLTYLHLTITLLTLQRVYIR